MYQTYMTYLPQNETKNKKTFPKTEPKLRKEVAVEFKIDPKTVSNYISLLDLPEAIKSLIVLNHGDNKKGFGVTYGFELSRLPQDQIEDFYEVYNPKDYSIDQYNKKVSEKI